jgi:hypothetical protein
LIPTFVGMTKKRGDNEEVGDDDDEVGDDDEEALISCVRARQGHAMCKSLEHIEPSSLDLHFSGCRIRHCPFVFQPQAVIAAAESLASPGRKTK